MTTLPVRPNTASPKAVQQLLAWLRQHRWLRRLLMVGPGSLWLLFFQGVPLILIVIMSFAKRTTLGGLVYEFTIENYVRFIDPLYLRILLDSFLVAAAVTGLTLLIGYPLAYFIAQQPAHHRTRWLMLIMIPFWTSMLVRTYAWIFILRNNGLVNTVLLKLNLIAEPLQLLFNLGASIMGLTYVLLPFMVLPIYTAIEKLDGQLVRAAYDLGARPARTFWQIVLPQTLPGVGAGSVLVMMPSIGLFFVADLLGGGRSVLIGNLIQRQFTQARDWPFGAASSIILTVLTVIMIFLYVRLGGKEEALF